MFKKCEVCLPHEYMNEDQIWDEYWKRYRYVLEIYVRDGARVKEIMRTWWLEWFDMCKLLESQVGHNKALELLKEHIKDSGRRYAERFKKYAVEKEITNDLLTIMNGYDKEWICNSDHFWMTYYPNAQNPTKASMVLLCHVGTVALETKDPKNIEYVSIFCDIDQWIRYYTNPKIKLTRPFTIWKGNKFCNWVWEITDQKQPGPW